MHLRTPRLFFLASILCIVSLHAAEVQATVPGSQKASPTDQKVRLLGLESLKGVPKAEQASIFEEYLVAYRAAVADHNQARQRELAEHATQLFPEFRRPWCHLAAARLCMEQWGPSIEAARRAETAR